ncbi:MAG: hypothetical protein ACR2QA_03760 [Solirubrobacteraceae bacterium]
MSAPAKPVRLVATMLASLGMAALGGCGSSSSSTQATSARASLAAGCRAGGADQTVRTAAHVFLLHVGPGETMVMPADVKAKHLTSGEEMLGGSMAGMSPGVASGSSVPRHLEVHICDRATGKVLTGAMPAITLAPSTGATPEQVPVMLMEGIGAGVNDYHYGNNVMMRRGGTYVVTVRLGSDRSVFKYTMPRTG